MTVNCHTNSDEPRPTRFDDANRPLTAEWTSNNLTQVSDMMPIHSSPTIASTAITAGSLFIVVGLLVWWVLAKEYRRGPALPIILLGTALSAVVVEPIFYNTLLLLRKRPHPTNESPPER
jgi:hypothetical protein